MRHLWHLICWQRVSCQLEMTPNIATPGALALTQGHLSSHTLIKRLKAWQAMQALGARVAPDGSCRGEAQLLLAKASAYAACLVSSNLMELDALIFHRSACGPSTAHSAHLTALAAAQLNKAQRRATQAALSKLGASCHFPRRVAFGPKELCSMALLGLSIKQGMHQAQRLTSHAFAEGSAGNLALIALRSLQIELGSSLHLLLHPTEQAPCVAPCWLAPPARLLSPAQHPARSCLGKAQRGQSRR